MKRERIPALLLAVLLAAFFLVQLPHLNNAPWEQYDSWRQTDTYTLAQNYVRYDGNPFHPQFNYDGTGDNFVQLELQILPWLASLVYRILGDDPYWVMRFMSLLCFLGSAVFVYALGSRMLKTPWAGLAAAAVYLVLPINVLYGRAIMPESVALLFYTGAVWFFLRWYEENKTSSLLVSAAFMAIAIMEKTPTAFAGLMIVVLYFVKCRTRTFRDWRFYTYGVISLGIPLLYYWVAAQIATFTFVEGIAENHIFTKMFTALFTPEAQQFFDTQLPYFFTWPAVFAAVVGLILCLWRRREALFLWAIAMILEAATIVAVIRLGYYLIFLSPLVALLTAAWVPELARFRKAGYAAAAVVVCAVAAFAGWNSLETAKTVVVVKDTITQQAEIIKSVTAEGDCVAIAASDPVLLGACERMGYRANIRYYDYIPTEPAAELDYYRSQGVRWFIAPSGQVAGQDGEAYMQLLRDTCKTVWDDELCTIFDLEAAK